MNEGDAVNKAEKPEANQERAAGSGLAFGKARQAFAARTEKHSSPEEKMMEEIVERENLKRALKRVIQNRGAEGADGMTVRDLTPYLKDHWPKLKEELLSGTYCPSPVKAQDIPKPNGGLRRLGIPTVLDRFIQQAILQVLTPKIDPTFSNHSYGYRPKRSAHQAVESGRRYVEEGCKWVVGSGVGKCVDRLNHDVPCGS